MKHVALLSFLKGGAVCSSPLYAIQCLQFADSTVLRNTRTLFAAAHCAMCNTLVVLHAACWLCSTLRVQAVRPRLMSAPSRSGSSPAVAAVLGLVLFCLLQTAFCCQQRQRNAVCSSTRLPGGSAGRERRRRRLSHLGRPFSFRGAGWHSSSQGAV